jgi:hypothetical protein
VWEWGRGIGLRSFRREYFFPALRNLTVGRWWMVGRVVGGMLMRREKLNEVDLLTFLL